MNQYFEERTCSFCGEKLSTSAVRCPGCNKDLTPFSTRLLMVAAALLGFVFFCAVLYFLARATFK